MRNDFDNDDGPDILEFNCTRPKFAQNARFICEAVPEGAVICLFKCEDCGQDHLRIELPDRLSLVAGKLESRIYDILGRSLQ
jgi:hypothetical protein